MKLRTAALIFVLSLGITPLLAQDVTLTRGVPADVNMSEEILKVEFEFDELFGR